MSKPVPQLAGGSPLVDAVNRILRVAMAKEPGHRYRTAQPARRRPRGDADDQPTSTTAGSPATSPPRPRCSARPRSPRHPRPPPRRPRPRRPARRRRRTSPPGPPTPARRACRSTLTVPPTPRRSRSGRYLLRRGRGGGGGDRRRRRAAGRRGGGERPGRPGGAQAFTEQSTRGDPRRRREGDAGPRLGADHGRRSSPTASAAGVDLDITSRGDCDGTLAQGGGSADAAPGRRDSVAAAGRGVPRGVGRQRPGGAGLPHLHRRQVGARPTPSRRPSSTRSATSTSSSRATTASRR